VQVKLEIFCCARDIRNAGQARTSAQSLALEVRRLLNRKAVLSAEYILDQEKLIFWHPKSRIAVMGCFYHFVAITNGY
jgi:hypothetical protein